MRRLAFLVAFTLVMTSLHADAQQPARATILYDAFGPASALQKDWGFAALVEYGGQPSPMIESSACQPEPRPKGVRRLVSLNFASWNQLERWLRRLEGLRRAA
jgi:hypothetical protein